MKYHVEFTDRVYKILSKMDKYTQKMIINWIETKLEGTTNPKLHGKMLTGDLAGLIRYRVGDYRIIAEIEEDKVIILIINIGHRRDIYS